MTTLEVLVVDIRVGSPPAIGSPGERTPPQPGAVEAKLLAVRHPRRQRRGPPQAGVERREANAEADPPAGKVLVLMISDASRLPEGLESGSFRVFLRFARR